MIGVSKSDQNQSLKNIAAHKKTIAALEISDSILESSVLIEKIYQEIGTQRKAANDRIKG